MAVPAPGCGEERLEKASLILAAGVTLAFAVVLRLRGMHFVWQHALPVCGPVLGMLLASVVYRGKRRDIPVARITFALAVQFWVACVVGGLCLAALGWRLPLADPTLAAADRAMGLDSNAFTTAVARIPLLAQTCALAYVVSSVAVFGATICLTLLKRTDRVAELAFIFVATILICAACGIAFPAVGAFTYHPIPADVRHLLPPGSGTYYMAGLTLYRSGAETGIDFMRLVGVITFPSFHACMGLMAVYCFRGMPRLFWPVLVFNLLVAVSIVPIGGHYFIDLLGGGATFALAAMAASAIMRPAGARTQTDAPHSALALSVPAEPLG
jgi:membrane-associated phospholipid phosphatase